MPKDIREILKEESDDYLKLSSNHRERFEDRLAKLHRPKKRSYLFLKIAATVILLVSLGYFFIPKDTIQQPNNTEKVVDLGSVSPEMKQIENYYLTAINYEMANLEATPESKAILDTYLKKITELTGQYKQLSNDLTVKEINKKTIDALITNLQLRLQLLLELKDTIQELKTSKTIDNENTTV